MKKYSIILAVDEKNGIGKNNTIPWRLQKEQQYFKEITLTSKNSKKTNAVVMGRKTWESIPKSVRPLPGRVNFILSSSYTENPTLISENVYGFNSFEKCHEYISNDKNIDKMFIIGGSYLYNLVLDSDYLEMIYLTRIYGEFNCDVFFSNIPSYFKIVKTSEILKEGDITYQMFEYKNKGSLLSKILKPGLVVGGIIFLIGIIFLLFQTFSSSGDNIAKTPEVEVEEAIPEPEIPPVTDTTTEEELTNTGTTDDTEEILEQGEIDEENNKGSFEVTDISHLEMISMSYPQTDVEELQSQIDEYVNSKKLEYKILLFNQKNAGIDGDIILDYEVISENEEEIVILFVDFLGEEKISEKQFIYTKK